MSTEKYIGVSEVDQTNHVIVAAGSNGGAVPKYRAYPALGFTHHAEVVAASKSELDELKTKAVSTAEYNHFSRLRNSSVSAEVVQGKHFHLIELPDIDKNSSFGEESIKFYEPVEGGLSKENFAVKHGVEVDEIKSVTKPWSTRMSNRDNSIETPWSVFDNAQSMVKATARTYGYLNDIVDKTKSNTYYLDTTPNTEKGFFNAYVMTLDDGIAVSLTFSNRSFEEMVGVPNGQIDESKMAKLAEAIQDMGMIEAPAHQKVKLLTLDQWDDRKKDLQCNHTTAYITSDASGASILIGKDIQMSYVDTLHATPLHEQAAVDYLAGIAHELDVSEVHLDSRTNNSIEFDHPDTEDERDQVYRRPGSLAGMR